MKFLVASSPLPGLDGPHWGRCFPIVIRYDCKRSRCICNTAQSVREPPALADMDSPVMRIVRWREFLESWAVHREDVWGLYDLPPVLALDMTGVMDIAD